MNGTGLLYILNGTGPLTAPGDTGPLAILGDTSLLARLGGRGAGLFGSRTGTPPGCAFFADEVRQA